MKNNIRKKWLLIVSALLLNMTLSAQTVEVGTLPGSHSVSASGGAVYSIPIPAVEGVSGLVPQVSITYNSQAGNDVAGYGCNISGTSMIAWGGKSVYYDGITAPPNLNEAPIYYLDGNRLLHKTGEPNAYRTEAESYSKIKRLTGVENSKEFEYFEIKDRNGTLYRYGSDINSQLIAAITPDNMKIVNWALDYVEDKDGNYIIYTYGNEYSYKDLKEIRYGKNKNVSEGNEHKLTFTYESRPDDVYSRIYDRNVIIQKRLKKVKSYVGDVLYKEYELIYEYDVYSRLVRVQENGANGMPLCKPTEFTWTNIPDYSITSSSVQVSSSWYDKAFPEQYFFPADMNGDGKTDLVGMFWEDKTKMNIAEVYFSQSSSETAFKPSSRSYELPSGANFRDFKAYQFDNMALHLQGDSRQWLVIPYFFQHLGKNWIKLHFLLSFSLSDAKEIMFELQASSELPAYTTGDLDNDGREEFVYIEKEAKNGKYLGHIISMKMDNAYNIETPSIPLSFSLNSKPERMIIADFDGDGFADLLVAHQTGYKIYWNQTGTSTTIFSDSQASTGNTFNGKCSALEVGDFNGDGMLDLIFNLEKSTTWRLAINNRNKEFTAYPLANITAKCDDEKKFICRVADFQGDGKSDVVIGDGTNTYWCYSQGLSMYVHEKATNGVRSLFLTENRYVAFGDFRGCGMPFFINYTYQRGTTPLRQTWTGFNNRSLSIENNKIKTITNGLGNKITFNYTTLCDNEVTTGPTPSTAYPIVDLRAPLPVVSHVWNGDETSPYKTSYKYGGGKIHMEGKGFLGFSRIVVEENGISTVNINDFNRHCCIAYPAGQKQYASASTTNDPMNETSYTHNIIYYKNSKHYEIQRTGEQFKDYLNKQYNQYRTTTYSEFEKGIPKKTITKYGNDLTETTTLTLKYDTLGTNWILGLPLSVTKKSEDSNSSIIDKQVNAYNAKNQVTETVSFTGDGSKKLKTMKYTYDVSGKVATETLLPYNTTDALTTIYEYSPDKRNLLSLTDPMGLKDTYTYDDFGKVLTHKSPKGAITSYEYDLMGRLRKTTYPDQTIKWFSRSSSATSYSETITRTSTTGYPRVTTDYDLYGQETNKYTRSFDGSYMYTDKAYERTSGLLASVTRPYKRYPNVGTIYKYDAYNRLIKEYESNNGKEINYAYNRGNVTKTINGRTHTSMYDAVDRLIRVEDAAGNIAYNYRPDGQLLSIVPLGDNKAKISFTYDEWGRRTSVNDPSTGVIRYVYDEWGNVKEEIDPQQRSTRYNYDKYGRLLSKVSPEDTVTYSYSNYELKSETSTHSTRTWTYDPMGRLYSDKEVTSDGKSFTRYYGYKDGNIVSTSYYINGSYVNESQVYAYGWHIGTKVNGALVWGIMEENEQGLVTSYSAGGNSRTCTYDDFGYLTSWKAADNSTLARTYSFNISDGTLKSCRVANNWTETYRYDNLERLTGYSDTYSTSRKETYYDAKGNITEKYAAGSLNYEHPTNPYAVTSLDFIEKKMIPYREQQITYTSFMTPNSISEGDYSAKWIYNGANERIKMVVKQGDSTLLTRHYLGGQYEMDETVDGTKEKLYIGGDYYSAHTVLVRENGGAWVTKVIDRDYLGSIIGVNGTNYDYSPWGVLRNPSTKEEYIFKDQQPELYLGRGYTGHEHLPWFGLINMNARLYDPVLGRFLSPDPYVQAPEFSQNFNRYSYCLNNPLKYTDKSGELWWIPVAVGAVFGAYNGGVIANNGEYNPTKWNYDSGKTWRYMAGGAVVGAVSGYVGGAIATSGMPFANTAGIIASSYINSLGTFAYTGGQTSISVSLGFASYDIINNSFGFIGKKGNKWYENLGYTFGALANISDMVSAIVGGGETISVNSAKASKDDWWGHSSITNEKGTGLVSFGPDTPMQKATSLSETWKNSIKKAKVWDTYLNDSGTWTVEVNNISTKALNAYSSNISRWDLLLNSCIGHSSRALWTAGVPNVYLFHPHALNFQLLIRQLGIYANPYMSQIPK